MVLLSHQNAMCPPGGSHFAHTFQRRRAFEGYVYTVREREIIPKKDYEREVGRQETIKAERWQALAAHVHGEKTKDTPKLTKKQEKEHVIKMTEPLKKFKWQDNFQDPEFIVPGNNKTAYKPQWMYKEPKDLVPKPDLTHTKIRPQWFPREVLDVNLPRVKLYGIDPVYYDNPPKFEIQNFWGCHAAPPRETPKSVDKWHSQEGWTNPSNRGVYKITEKQIPKEQRTNNLPPL